MFREADRSPEREILVKNLVDLFQLFQQFIRVFLKDRLPRWM